MSRIKAFRFSWYDAWGRIDRGYDSILETSDKGDIIIRFLMNSEPHQIVLTEKESEFIDDLAFLKTWALNMYHNDYCLDGTSWVLNFSYDSITICSHGRNGFPDDFAALLKLFHEKFSIPKSDIEKDYENHLIKAIQQTIITYEPEIGKYAMYF